MKHPGNVFEQRPEDVVQHILDGIARETLQAEERVQRRADEEALHDFRVGIRRIRSTLKAYKGIVSYGKQQEAILKELKALSQLTNKARDMEVMFDWLKSQEDEFAGVEYCLPLLQEIELLKEQQLEDGLKVEALDAKGVLNRVCSEQLFSDPKVQDRAFGTVFRKLVRSCSKALEKRLLKVQTIDDIRAAHQARIRAKLLRYVLEPFEKTLPGCKRCVKTLKSLQDLFGEFNDLSLIARELKNRQGDFGLSNGNQRALESTEVEHVCRRNLTRLCENQRRRVFSNLESVWLKGENKLFFQELENWLKERLD